MKPDTSSQSASLTDAKPFVARRPSATAVGPGQWIGHYRLSAGRVALWFRSPAGGRGDRASWTAGERAARW